MKVITFVSEFACRVYRANNGGWVAYAEDVSVNGDIYATTGRWVWFDLSHNATAVMLAPELRGVSATLNP